ncbi:MAG TPA: hypothetical protein VFR15_14365 [Chloroflexia bacterium]|nr:hypothetical protein [Chloroflexia bacterium]
MRLALDRRQQLLLAWSMAAASVGLLVLAGLLMLANNSVTFDTGIYLFIFNAFMPVGLLIAVYRPENTIGWLFLAIALSTDLAWAMIEYARMALITSPGSLTGGLWVAWLSYFPQTAGWILMFTSLLLFPTGRPLSRGWGIFIWANIVYFELATLLGALKTPALFIFPDIPNPAYVEGLQGVPFELVEDISGFANIGAVALTGVLRFRRGNPVEKQQLKWFMFGALIGPFIEPTAQFVLGVPVEGWGLLAMLVPLAAVAVAILRYRLYDIDIIIRRTLAYAVLTAMLALTYWGGVIVLQALLRPITGEGNDLAVVATTLLVAAVFLPLRTRVQAFIDRRFYRRKYDAARTLAAFSETARDEVDLDRLAGRLLEVVEETMQPAHVSLWLARPERKA